MNKNKKLVIIGAGETAEIAYEYFTYDSDYDVIAFSVNEKYIKNDKLFGLPIVPIENINKLYPEKKYDAFIAVSYTNLNKNRTKLYNQVKEKGYRLATYVSSQAFVWRNVQIGDNCLILENNVIQSNVQIGNNVYLWSGNHIGHRTVINDNCYISSHVTISGFCNIGSFCFIGVNSCLNDRINISANCIIGSGAVVIQNTEPNKVYIGNPATPMKKKICNI